MHSLEDALKSILTQPTPGALVALQGALLTSGRPGESLDRALDIAGQFHAYLCELETKTSAQEYSELASRLDIGAVGMVAVENLVASKKEELWGRLLLGGLGETLMVAASRQYVKAWQAETGLVHRGAAWHLAEALWRLSAQMQPEIAPTERWQAVQSLLAPVYDPQVPASHKAQLLGRIFQVLLFIYGSGVTSASEVEA
jgi:hypothetical protein